jgi:hypothetical protein
MYPVTLAALLSRKTMKISQHILQITFFSNEAKVFLMVYGIQISKSGH